MYQDMVIYNQGKGNTVAALHRARKGALYMVTVFTYDKDYKDGAIPTEIMQANRPMDGDMARMYTKSWYVIYRGMSLRFEFYTGEPSTDYDGVYNSVDNHRHFANFHVECGDDGVVRKWWERF